MRSTSRILLGLLACLGLGGAVAAQFTFDGGTVGESLGESVTVVGDLDGDGVPDLASGAPGGTTGGPDTGLVRLHSGADGTPLFVIEGFGALDQFGWSVAAAGDADGDRVPDLLVGAPQDGTNGVTPGLVNRFGYVVLVSGATGEPLLTMQGEPLSHTSGGFFGHAVATAGDVDGDGLADLAIGEPRAEAEGTLPWSQGPGRLHVRSGLDGRVLHEHVGLQDLPGDEIGRAIVNAGDRDGDDVDDLFIGAPGANPEPGSAAPGALMLVSGATGDLLWIVYGPLGSYANIGTHIASAGDTDADGTHDVLVGGRDRVHLLSGVDGQLLRSWSTGTFPYGDGPSVSAAGDVDADGYDDVAIGTPITGPSDVTSPGTVRVYSGKDGFQLGQFDGTQPGERFGASLALLSTPGGDLLVIGAPGHDGPAGVDAGRVRAALPHGDLQIPHVLTLPDLVPDTSFGTAVAGAGDVDNDGWEDVVVGMPYEAANAGRVVVFSGRDGALLFDAAGVPAERLGYAVAYLGDVDHDGYADVMAAAPFATPTGPGKVRVWSGRDGGLLYQVAGLSPNDQFGRTIAGVGDLDQDGAPDFAVSAPYDDVAGVNFGAVRVYSGVTGAQLLEVLGDETNAELGSGIAGVGDVDGDGVPDIATGSRLDDGVAGLSAGRVIAWSGADGSQIFSREGATSFMLLGWSLAGPGDLDGDGVPDVLAGQIGDDAFGIDAGSALLLSGVDGAVIDVLPGQAPSGAAGTSVAALGDITGDGVSELGLGAPNAQSARVFDGATREMLIALQPPSGTNQFGIVVAGGGDVDNDGVPDVVVGATGASFFNAPNGAAIVFSIAPSLSPWESAGHVLPGAKAPRLTGEGPLLPATLATLALTDALPGTSSTLVIGFSSLFASFKGGTMVPFPNLLLSGLIVQPDGSATLTAPWPAGLPAGANLWFQHWMADPRGAVGLAASNAVKATLP